MKKKRRKLRVFIIVYIALIAVAAGYILFTNWESGKPRLNYTYNTAAAAAIPYPDASFAVISDIHLYDTSLGTTGPAFEAVMQSDRKLLLDSQDLLHYAVGEILKSDVQFVLVSGDMTKDGELLCHNDAAAELKRLTDASKQVYVIPGNHDIDNPGAFSYSGDTATPVANITPDDFTRIYAGFGYSSAIDRDADSLSYVAEPVDGLWLLALDSCRYRDNKPGGEEVVGGVISQTTEDWIEKVLGEAQRQNKAVIVMVHHGVVEHWTGQHKLHPDYLLPDYKHFGEMLAGYNVRLAFTGHYHAQDITEGLFGGKYLYDVETGALVTTPCPIRYCTLKDNQFTVESETVADKLHPGTDFEKNAEAFVKANVIGEAKATLNKYFVKGKDADIISDAVGDAFLAHYAGDENPADMPVIDESQLSLWGRFILYMERYVIVGLWHDLPPADNNISFSLK